jgi:rSAM/selenodomain-associated transferase 2
VAFWWNSQNRWISPLAARRAPAFSVIIPTLNEAAELSATLDSVRDALGPDAEIIVVDGGSSDGTVDRARGKARVIGSAPGRGRQLNAGLDAAGGDILLFLHADTWLRQGAAAAILKALEHPEVSGGCFRIALRGPTAHHAFARILARAINWRSRWLTSATGDQAIFARRSACKRVGGFREEELFEDVIFYRRLRRLGRVAVIGPPVLTSDRRWRRLGYPRTVFTHLVLRLLFLLRVPPAQLARLHQRVR